MASERRITVLAYVAVVLALTAVLSSAPWRRESVTVDTEAIVERTYQRVLAHFSTDRVVPLEQGVAVPSFGSFTVQQGADLRETIRKVLAEERQKWTTTRIRRPGMNFSSH